MITTSQFRTALQHCLQEAGDILLRGFGKTHKIAKKAPVSIVTEIDMAADRKIISILRKRFPDHQILTEESQPVLSPSPYRWIIDPLDGTTNFAHGIALSCVSIALAHRDRVVLGGIYNPMLRELFLAERGKGATLNGKRIRVSDTARMIDSLLVTGFPYDRQEKAGFYLRFFRGLMEKCQGIRRLGAAALDLAYVACGRFEAFWEFNLQPWDVAAGALIVEESGGKVTDFSGKPLDVLRPRQLLSSNRTLHPRVLGIIKKILAQNGHPAD